jgi:hypothetical protein
VTGTFDIRGAFLSKQTALEASYSGIRAATQHPGAIGDQGEADWVEILRDFLPNRYQVGPIFAIDHTGATSDQIDVAIYDQQYSPQWFGTHRGVQFVPVESVYAAFEVKPDLTAEHLRYAQDKVTSVRNLRRSSAAIVHAGGTFSAINPDFKPIIGGILTTRTGWSDRDATIGHLENQLPTLGQPGSLNIGIALDTVAFDHTPDLDSGDDVAELRTAPRSFSDPGNQLIHLAIRLFRQLQSLGTVLALDLRQYERALTTEPDSTAE